MIQNTGEPWATGQLRRDGSVGEAIQMFWSKGYDGVTSDDLVAAMDVGRPSL
jgi:AcrR family transcriptional regulator